MKKITLIGLIVFCSPRWVNINAQIELNNKIRTTISSGFEYRLGKTAPGVDKYYIKGIRSGENLNADISYYFKSSSAIGLKYTSFWSAGTTFNVPNVISNINVSYLGPILYTNIPLHSQKSILSYGLSLGYIYYKDDGWINNEKTMIKGNTIGGLMELCYDFKIYRNFYIGINTGFSTGVLSKVSLNGVDITLDKEEKENLSKVFASVGLRFIK